MVKTNISTLMLKLEIGIVLVDAILKPFSSVIGKMALVCQSNYIGLTYSNIADIIFKFVAAAASVAFRIGMVFDVSQHGSIKNSERGQYFSGKTSVKNNCGCYAN